MNISLKHAVAVLTALAILGTCASSASAAGRVWGGVGSNDLGQSTITFKVRSRYAARSRTDVRALRHATKS